MDQVAARVGVTKPVLYTHFGSKHGLLLACVARARAELLEVTSTAAAAAGNPEEMLRSGTLAFFDYLERNAPAWTLLYSEASVAGEALEGIRAQQTDFIATLLAAQAPGTDRQRLDGLGARDRRGVRAAGALARQRPHGDRRAGHGLPHGPRLDRARRGGTIVAMSTTAPRLLQVRRSERVTPRMVRVTLGGDELAGFAGEGPDRRIKMFFPVPGQDRPAVPRATSGGPLWPAGRAPAGDPHVHGAPVRPRRGRARRRLRAARGPRPGRRMGARRPARRVGGRLRARRPVRARRRPQTSMW